MGRSYQSSIDAASDIGAFTRSVSLLVWSLWTAPTPPKPRWPSTLFLYVPA